MSTIKVLSNHYTPETGLVVRDYPYGFVLRCQIRYWLEVHPKRGTRFVSQTTNPKKGDVWNLPKKSTYCIVGAMYLDEKGYVQWAGLSAYDTSKAKDWLKTYRAGLTEDQIKFCEGLIKIHEKRESAKAPIT